MTDEGKHECIKHYLKEWRIYANFTQAELARRMGVTPPQISRIESGQRQPDLLFLQQFATVVECKHYADPLIFPPEPDNLLMTGELAAI